MPPPREPPLSVACYYNRVDEVRRLLAEGADPLAVAGGGPGLTNRYPAIFQCVRHGNAQCLKALLTAQIDLVDSVKTEERRARSVTPGAHPLLHLLYHLAERGSIPLECLRGDLECVHLLLKAGASLETVVSPIRVSYEGGRTYQNDVYDPFEYARQSGIAALVRMLEDARRLRYSPKTHLRFPRPARYVAAELLRLCYQIESGVLTPVWAEHVLPFLVSRTSRGVVPSPPPALLFIDALSESELKKMVACGDAAKLELRRRGIGKYPPLV